MWETLGCCVKEFTPELHDRLIAEISHMPHIVAAALIGAASDDALSLAASGFLDTTRIASGDPDLWVDICLANRDAMLSALRAVQGQLDNFAAALEAADPDQLRALLHTAKQRRDNRIEKEERKKTEN